MKTPITILTAFLLIAAFPVGTQAEESEPATFSETFTYTGTVGCAVGAGPIRPADQCDGTTEFFYAAAHDDAIQLDVLFTYEASLAEQLSLKFFGWPGQSITGPSPVTATFDESDLVNTSFEAKAEVRSAQGVALDTPFEVQLTWTYLGEAAGGPEAASSEGGATETFVFDGLVGCSVAAGPVQTRDQCDGHSIFEYQGAGNVTTMTATLAWDDTTAPTLNLRFFGSPGTSHTGGSPLVVSFSADDLGAFPTPFGKAEVRAGLGVVYDLPFTLTLDLEYA